MNSNGVEVILFGQRGAVGEASENTLGGFAYAWETGVRAFDKLKNRQRLI